METPVKILVVDDEMPICELMKINLELAGFSVDIANSAEEALQKHLADYALMVFDIMMGEISGLELVSKVRAMPDVANVPIIVCTALGDEAPLIDGFTRGADDYIKKPFSMREFVVRVKSLLRRVKPEQPSIAIYKTLSLDSISKTCTIDGSEIALTKGIRHAVSFPFKPRQNLLTRRDSRQNLGEERLCGRPHNRCQHQPTAQETRRI